MLVCTMENEMRARFRVICEPSESSLTVDIFWSVAVFPID